MKLLTKTTLHIATLSLFLFFIMGIIFFQFLKHFSISELDQELLKLREMVDRQLDPLQEQARESRAPEIPGIDRITIEPGKGDESFIHKGDTLLYDSIGNRHRTYRLLRYHTSAEGIPLAVTLYKSTTPTDQLVERVTLMMTLMVILFLAGIFILNRFLFGNLWKEFFTALEKLKAFDTTKEPVVLGEQDIDEFNELNRVLERMTRRLSSEYKELKEYTDHTTHELQTPLAVIMTKIELLLQSKKLGPEEVKLIQSVNRSADHLSRLNTALTLITRIENRQFTGREEIRLAALLDDHLEMLGELMEIRKITIEKEYKDEVSVVMDAGLAGILVANLLKNAIVHNVEGGSIRLELKGTGMVICNDGPPLPFDRNELFSRFVRNKRLPDSFGLGLWLARKICESYGFHIDYQYPKNRHCFQLEFKP